jgi:predicted nucleic acid-binding protein
VIVIDASAALTSLLNDGPARAAIGREQLHAPHLIDSEVASGLRRRVLAGQLSPAEGWSALDTLRHLGMTRHAAYALTGRIWELGDNLSTYDATYVSLAEALDCNLLTADARITRARGLRCSVTLVPR